MQNQFERGGEVAAVFDFWADDYLIRALATAERPRVRRTRVTPCMTCDGWSRRRIRYYIGNSLAGSEGPTTDVVGGKRRDAKTLSGFGGGGVVEVVTDFRSDTFRAVYTARYAESVYVLHVFQKKSKSERETPHREIELVRRRLREAEEIVEARTQ